MVTGKATATKIAAVGGQAYELRPAADGGVDFLSLKPGSATATVEHEHDGAVSTLGTGGAAELTLFQGRAGHNTVVGWTTATLAIPAGDCANGGDGWSLWEAGGLPGVTPESWAIASAVTTCRR